MIILKANSDIKTVFHKMIKTMGEEVKWTEVFVINNNDIILAGTGRSLFFNFDNRRAFSKSVELPIKEDRTEQLTKNTLMENALNMILYAFGKWGGIQGLKVEMNFDQLNLLINKILAEIEIEAILTKDNFRFYKVGVQITYEEVIQLILDQSKPEEDSKKETEENSNDDAEEELEENQKEGSHKYDLGLWHNMCWEAGNFSFLKDELNQSDRVKSRLGNNFYMVNYKCPDCSEKLYMVVYPEGKEARIETDEEAVYMARSYTCSTCNHFYTPKPQKLLLEGDVYNLAFEDDRTAYEDYLELLGRQGERISNCNFNQYESEYYGKSQETPPQLAEICSDIESMSEQEIEELKDKMDSGFYPQKSVEKYHKKVEKEQKSRKHKKEHSIKTEPKTEPKQRRKAESLTLETKQLETKQLEMKQSKMKQPEGMQFSKAEKEVNRTAFEGLKDIVAALLKGEHDFFTKAVGKLAPKQLHELKVLIQSEPEIEEKEKKTYLDKIDLLLYPKKEKELQADSGKEKSYTELLQQISYIKKEAATDNTKKTIVESLMESLQKRGEKELNNIVLHIPQNVSRKQYNQLREKMEQYKEIDNRPHKKNLDQKRDAVEKLEIGAFLKRVSTTDRKSLFEVYHKLKAQAFEERNVNPFLEKIQGKIYAIDEAAIKKICKDPADITFEEGLQAYDEISAGDFLPELKLDILGMIDKRLMKMKMDECEQLVKKLSKEMKPILEDFSRIYFYDVRKMMRGDAEDEESQIIIHALNTYASGRGKYEYPIIICDSSFSANGGGGFVLTPDHIFYNGLIDSGVMNVMNIESVTAGNGLLTKGIYANRKSKGKVKLSNSLKSNHLVSFAKVLNEFVSYLKEKPESRKVSYMAKEKHTLKCCYRCGYVYKEGNVCPKCGGKFNE